MVLTVTEKKEAMSMVRMEYGDNDPWGTTMSHMFAIADVIYHDVLYPDGENLPAAWQYMHSPVCGGVDTNSWPDAEYSDYLVRGEMTIDQLLYAGNVLNRYASVLTKAGLAY